MILLFILLSATADASEDRWQDRCAACSLPDTECRMELLADRQMAEIKLKRAPQNKVWLQNCGGVDVLHIDFDLLSIDEKLDMHDSEVDTLILSNVSSVSPGALSAITRSNVNSIIFCNIRELGRELPNIGRIKFTGTLDKTGSTLIPKEPIPSDAMVVKFDPSFTGLIDSARLELAEKLNFLLLQVTTGNQFLLLTEEIVKSTRKPIINVIIDASNEDDLIYTADFMQRLALVASKIDVRRSGAHFFTKTTMPKLFIPNLIRYMFVTYNQIRHLPESSDLEIILHASADLTEDIRNSRAVHCWSVQNGFRCAIDIKSLFDQCESAYFNLKRQKLSLGSVDLDLDRSVSFSSRASFGTGSRASSLDVLDSTRNVPDLKRPLSRLNRERHILYADRGAIRTDSDARYHPKAKYVSEFNDSLEIKKEFHLAAEDNQSAMVCNSEHPEYEREEEGNQKADYNLRGQNEDEVCQNRLSSELNSQQSEDRNQNVDIHSDNDLCSSADEQAATLSEMGHPEEVAGSDQFKHTGLDKPVVMISIIAGSVSVLTIALVVICISTKRRRLKRSLKLVSPSTSKNETDPETLWW